jgi:hypothetical protein
MNRFQCSDNHKLGNMFFDANRPLNIHRMINVHLEHKPIINHNTCCEMVFNPYTQYDLHCGMFSCNSEDVSNNECECIHIEHTAQSVQEEDEDHHIQLEQIYNDSLTIHKFDISEERNKMRRDLLKNREGHKISIKDFLKKV